MYTINVVGNKLYEKEIKIKTMYIEKENFIEVNNFVELINKKFNNNLKIIKINNHQNDFKPAFSAFLNENKEIKAILIGNRRSDPNSSNFFYFN